MIGKKMPSKIVSNLNCDEQTQRLGLIHANMYMLLENIKKKNSNIIFNAVK
jgi:hypothetical protein